MLTVDFHDWTVHIRLIANNTWAADLNLWKNELRFIHKIRMTMPFCLVFFVAFLDASAHISFGQLCGDRHVETPAVVNA
jgi:hypothetical protein